MVATMDSKRGRSPRIRPDGESLVFEFGVLGGELQAPVEQFRPTPRTRLVIRCDPEGTITSRILDRKSSS